MKKSLLKKVCVATTFAVCVLGIVACGNDSSKRGVPSKRRGNTNRSVAQVEMVERATTEALVQAE